MDPIDSDAPNRSNRSALHGQLRNGCPSGDPAKAPRCCAKTRRGSPYQAPAMRNAKGNTHGAGFMAVPQPDREVPARSREPAVALLSGGEFLSKQISVRLLWAA